MYSFLIIQSIIHVIEALYNYYDIWYRKCGRLLQCKKSMITAPTLPFVSLVIKLLLSLYRLITTFIEWTTPCHLYSRVLLVQILCLEAINKFMQGLYFNSAIFLSFIHQSFHSSSITCSFVKRILNPFIFKKKIEIRSLICIVFIKQVTFI